MGRILAIILCLVLTMPLAAQSDQALPDQETLIQNFYRAVDSVDGVYHDTTRSIDERGLAGYQGAYSYMAVYPDTSLMRFQDLLEWADIHGSASMRARAQRGIGSVLTIMDRPGLAIQYFREALPYFKAVDDSEMVMKIYMYLGDAWISLDEDSVGIDYLLRSLAIAPHDTPNRPIPVLIRLSEVFLKINRPDLAEKYAQKRLDIFRAKGWEISTEPEIIMIHAHAAAFKGDSARAYALLDSAMSIADAQGDFGLYTKVRVHLSLGRFTLAQGRAAEARYHCGFVYSALDSAIDFKSYRQEVCDCLYRSNKALGNTGEALRYHEELVAFRTKMRSLDFVRGVKNLEFDQRSRADSLAAEKERLETTLAFEQELSTQTQLRNGFIAGGVVLLLVAGGLYSRNRYMKRSNDEITRERDRSDSLLLNILPAEIARELKERGESSARDFDNVTILFTDFIEFTETAERMDAKDLVDELNVCFKQFDEIVGRYGIEKIKTIGDAYMAAGGVPVPDEQGARKVVMAALEMADFIATRERHRTASGMSAFRMRTGINTGPVVAGIVGVKKFQYDVWGDTVNTASRMESYGEAGKVNVSQSTYELLQDDPAFRFTPRGVVDVKGKGEIDMWFVERV